MKISLKRKFFIAFLILILVPLITVSFFSYSNARKFLMEGIKDYNELLVQNMIMGVQDTVFSYKNLSESILYNIGLSKTNQEKKEVLLRNKKNDPYNIKLLSILDKSGKEIVRSDDRELEDRSDQPEFYQIKENQKEHYVAWLSFNPVVEVSTIIISVPLFEEGEFQGALVSKIFLSDIWSKMVTGYTSPKDNIYLLTQEGKPVARILASSRDFQSDGLEKIAQELAEKKAVVIQETDTEIGEMLVISDSLPIFEWELVVFRQISEIYKPASALENDLALITFIVLIFIFIVSIYFSQLIVNPIKELHKGIEIIEKGDLDYRVDIQTNDEIAELGTAFNQMAKELKKYHGTSEESKNVLKIKVKARTKELEELAKSLDDKVKERTEELEKRLSELERFHKLTVGRELKIIELKKELAKLKSRKR